MKFRFRFPPDLKETIEQCFENEKKVFERKFRSARGLSFLNIAKWAFKKKYGVELKPFIFWNFISDTEAILTVETGIDYMAMQNPILRKAMSFGSYKRYKEYEKISDGKIKVDVIIPEKCKHEPEEFNGKYLCKNCRHPVDKNGKLIKQVKE